MVATALACEATAFVASWTLHRLVLRTDGWRSVAVPQLVGNAASNVLPAGSAVGAVLRMRLLTRYGFDLTRVIVSLAFTGMLSTLAGLALLPAIALLPFGDKDVN